MKAGRKRQSTTVGMGMLLVLIGCGIWVMGAASQSVAAHDAAVTCRVETDRNVLPAGGPQKVVVKVTLLPVASPKRTERPPVNLALVLDRSSSMTGDKLAKAKEAAIEALGRLSSRDVFSVVVYDHEVETIVPAQKARNVEWIKERIRSIQARGNTALFGGVSQGSAEIRKNLSDQYVHRIILLSDGLANVGPSSPDDLGRLGAALIKEGISVTTVGVGTDYNEDLMTRLARKSDGNTYFVESSNDLPRIFAAELGDVLNVVAKHVRVIIDFPKGVKPLAIIGREGRVKGNSAEIFMNQLYGGQHKYVLLEAELPPGKAGTEMEIASARVLYESAFNRREETSSAQAQARFSEDMERVRQSANVRVQSDYQLNLNALAQEKAIALSDRGKKDEAVKELKKSVRRLKEAAKKYGDPNLSNKANEVERQAAQIEAAGMTKRNRKVLRTNSQQQVLQQSNR